MAKVMASDGLSAGTSRSFAGDIIRCFLLFLERQRASSSFVI